jgi:hypothetical protein
MVKIQFNLADVNGIPLEIQIIIDGFPRTTGAFYSMTIEMGIHSWFV